MAKYLVIVESPAKVKTIKKFLGSSYEVVASQGHVRDMPKSQLGFDEDYNPKYITIRGKGDVLSVLRKEVKKAEKIYLATDPDREGEAISWHLYEALNLKDKKVSRITFNEITQSAVKDALKHPRDIDMNLVDAQQTRRVLDRMVGYRISPLLWTKIKRGLSAGRVQSVALKMICDREAEINSFNPEEYWTLDASLNIDGEKKPIIASFYGKEDNKIDLKDKKSVDLIIDDLSKKKFKVTDIKNGTRKKNAPLPFTTSTLQQEASKVLGFSTQKTMRLAQTLYEGVSVGKDSVGVITYLRTDSVRVSDEAMKAAENYIIKNYGKEYFNLNPEHKGTGKKIQDAHEAIRPTDLLRTPEMMKEYLNRDELRLYTLIYKRFLASCMSPCVFETVLTTIKAGEYIFRVSASKISFDGYRNVYTSDDDEKDSKNSLINKLDKDSKLSLDELIPTQHFTQSPAHFTEAGLVKAMEEQGIGRPSTYAPTITTIIARHYVIKENKNLYVSDLGEVVNNMMEDAFPTIIDVNFTANMETLLDAVEEGTVQWKTVVSNFYPDLDEAVNIATDNLQHVKIQDEVSEETCELCGRKMVFKFGPHGKFLACPGFPECRNTKSYMEKIGVSCPKCGKDVVVRKTKKGRRYYGCESAPDCDFMIWQKPLETKCDKCGFCMIKRGNKIVCGNEECEMSK